MSSTIFLRESPANSQPPNAFPWGKPKALPRQYSIGAAPRYSFSWRAAHS